MFRGGLERFSGREFVDLAETQVLIVVHGEFRVFRIFSHFGHEWRVQIAGTWLLLPAGRYYAEGDALLYVGGYATQAAPLTGS